MFSNILLAYVCSMKLDVKVYIRDTPYKIDQNLIKKPNVTVYI